MSWSVLVVDDEPMTREMICMMLQHVGFKTVEAEDGLDALEKVRQNCPDIMLLDVMMPNMDGLEVCETLRQEETTADLPIVMFSGKTQPSAIEEGLLAGANEYLCKPLSPKEVIAVIHKLLDSIPSPR